MVKPPCTRDCEGRSATCHGTCQLYIDYVNAKEKEKEEIENCKKYSNNHTSFVVQQRISWKRNHR
jgi:hypothetical protein